MNIALYLRVSTDEQSTELQERELRAYCKERGFHISHIFNDQGFSGSNTNRPALKKLLALSGFDAVLVWKIDRFARSLSELLDLLKTLESKNIKFISLKDNIDLSTPQGRFMLQILGAFAEFEASMIRERVRAGMLHAMRFGTSTGRPIGRHDKIPPHICKHIYVKKKRGQKVSDLAKYYLLTKSGAYKAIQKHLASRKDPINIVN